MIKFNEESLNELLHYCITFWNEFLQELFMMGELVLIKDEAKCHNPYTNFRSPHKKWTIWVLKMGNFCVTYLWTFSMHIIFKVLYRKFMKELKVPQKYFWRNASKIFWRNSWKKNLNFQFSLKKIAGRMSVFRGWLYERIPEEISYIIHWTVS